MKWSGSGDTTSWKSIGRNMVTVESIGSRTEASTNGCAISEKDTREGEVRNFPSTKWSSWKNLDFGGEQDSEPRAWLVSTVVRIT